MDGAELAKHLLCGHTCSNCVYSTWKGKLITTRCILDDDYYNFEEDICKEYANDKIDKHSGFLKEVPLRIINKEDVEYFQTVVNKFRDL